MWVKITGKRHELKSGRVVHRGDVIELSDEGSDRLVTFGVAVQVEDQPAQQMRANDPAVEGRILTAGQEVKGNSTEPPVEPPVEGKRGLLGRKK